MKILVISKIFPNKLQPTFGTFVLDETRALALNNDIRVIAPVPWFPRIELFKKWSVNSQIPDSEEIGGISVGHPRYLVTPKVGRSFYGQFYIWGIRKTVEKLRAEFKFDVIVAHYAYPTGYAAAYYSRKYRCPLLLKTHGSDIHEDLNYPSRRKGAIHALAKADKIVAVCLALKAKIIQQNISDDKIKVIYNAVNQKHFRILDQNFCREELGLPMQQKLVLFVGNLIAVKNVPLLIRAFSQALKKTSSPAKLIIIGQGNLRSQLERLAEALGLQDKILFTGAQPHEKIPLWMNACDFLCLSSNNEGYPTVLNEAKACGLSVVATNVGGVMEIVNELDAVVPPNDVSAFALAIEKKLDLERRNFEQRCSRFLRSWEDVADEMQLELEQLVQSF